MAQLRSPICTVLGHVDHGKSSILDSIRGSAITSTEAGGITQAIGASIIPLETIRKVCGDLVKNINFTIPGLLFIDTPGHEAFSNLRKRGGNLADIAIVVIDINEGIKPQTKESIEILKQYKTPFIIVLNKIDMISRFRTGIGKTLLTTIDTQEPQTMQIIEEKLYEIVGSLHELGFPADRFDRVSDYTKQIALIPTSAKTKDGIPELLMVVSGLAQKFLEKCLDCNIDNSAKGTVLEVNEQKGLGKTLDVILYDGTLRKNDTIVIGGLSEPIVAKVRVLLKPDDLTEMRDKKGKFKPVTQAVAATGVKISAPGIEDVIAGMPLLGATDATLEAAKDAVQKEVEEVLIETDKSGIIVKADTLGSLEALVRLLKEKGIKIRKASIGDISKRDSADACSNLGCNPDDAVILGFNVKIREDADTKKAKTIVNSVIYKLIEDFEAWRDSEKKKGEGRVLERLTRPFKLEILRGYIFRQSNPAVVGVEVLSGKAKAGATIMKNGKEISSIKGIQLEKENVTTAEKGKQVAISLDHVTVGRQINEGDILYSSVPEPEFRTMKELKAYLKPDEVETLKEIAEMKRKDNPLWGV